MKITAMELYHISMPLPRPFWPSWIPGYPQTHNRFTLLKLETDEGIDGWSAGSAMGREREGLGDLLGPYLLGQDPTDIGRIQDLLKQAAFLGWRNFWIEPACWDIMGKQAGKPVYQLLGGQPRAVEAYASTGEQHPVQTRVEELLALQAQGFRTAKVRIKHATLEEDLRDLEGIAKGVAGRLKLGVDVNQGWLVSIVDRVPAWDFARAKTFADACADLGYGWLEEPLNHRDYNGNAALKAVARLPISGAEINFGWDEVKVMLEKDCFHIYQPDALFAGGLSQGIQIAQACKAAGRGFTPHAWSNGIGLYINWNLLLADPENPLPLEYPLEPISWRPEHRDALITPILPDSQGLLQPFTRPGLGFEIDRKALRRYGKRFFRLTERGLKLKVVWEKGLRTALEVGKRKAASNQENIVK